MRPRGPDLPRPLPRRKGDAGWLGELGRACRMAWRGTRRPAASHAMVPAPCPPAAALAAPRNPGIPGSAARSVEHGPARARKPSPAPSGPGHAPPPGPAASGGGARRRPGDRGAPGGPGGRPRRRPPAWRDGLACRGSPGAGCGVLIPAPVPPPRPPLARRPHLPLGPVVDVPLAPADPRRRRSQRPHPLATRRTVNAVVRTVQGGAPLFAAARWVLIAGVQASVRLASLLRPYVRERVRVRAGLGMQRQGAGMPAPCRGVRRRATHDRVRRVGKGLDTRRPDLLGEALGLPQQVPPVVVNGVFLAAIAPWLPYHAYFDWLRSHARREVVTLGVTAGASTQPDVVGSTRGSGRGTTPCRRPGHYAIGAIRRPDPRGVHRFRHEGERDHMDSGAS